MVRVWSRAQAASIFIVELLREKIRRTVVGGKPRFSQEFFRGDELLLIMEQTGMRAADMQLCMKRGLRFDKVAVGLIACMLRALCDDVPDGMTLLFTVTAPIRVGGRQLRK
jgi:hypothetical protein